MASALGGEIGNLTESGNLGNYPIGMRSTGEEEEEESVGEDDQSWVASSNKLESTKQ